MLCRLLNYLLANVWTQPKPRIEPFANHGKMLLATRGHDTAEIGRVEIVAADEGQNGVYLDPVAMGLTVIDAAMQSSLRLAWHTCLPDIRSGQQTGETTAVRFSPELHGVTVLEGGSAGGLFACGMLAAATRTPLNQDVTASIALDASNPDNPAPHQINVLAVHEDSIDAKLDIAARHGLSVVLEAGQAEKKQQDRGNAPPEIRAASNLWQAFRQLTGDARKEAVLKAYASACVETWETQPERAGGRPERFIEPHFAHVPPEHELLDGQEHAARAASGEAASREAKLGDRYQPLLDKKARAAVTPETSAQVGADELIQLLNLGQHLCLAEDANAGKTIFTHWLKAFCAGPAGQQALFDNRPPLVFRWENRQGRVHWPNGDDRREVESRLRQDLESAVAPFCRIGNETVAAGEVVEYALDRGRVLLIFDAADQVEERDQLLNVLLTDSRLSHCRVVVTGRSFVFRSTEGAKQFPRDRWQFTTLLGFDDNQKARYLADVDPNRNDFRTLFAHYSDIEELLEIPGMIAMVRELALVERAEHPTGTTWQLARLRTRCDFYYQYYTRKILAEAGKQRTPGLDVDTHRERWQMMLAVTAFRMVLQRRTDYTVQGHLLANVKRDVIAYCQAFDPKLDWTGQNSPDRHWQALARFSTLSDHSILEPHRRDSILSYRHKGWMEFFFGLF